MSTFGKRRSILGASIGRGGPSRHRNSDQTSRPLAGAAYSALVATRQRRGALGPRERPRSARGCAMGGVSKAARRRWNSAMPTPAPMRAPTTIDPTSGVRCVAAAAARRRASWCGVGRRSPRSHFETVRLWTPRSCASWPWVILSELRTETISAGVMRWHCEPGLRLRPRARRTAGPCRGCSPSPHARSLRPGRAQDRWRHGA